MTEPKRTVAEALDAARTGEDFARVINSLFAGLEAAKDDESD